MASSVDSSGSMAARDNTMNELQPRFAGVELYFEDLDRAREFYLKTLGLELTDEEAGRYAKFDSGAGFVCLERKLSESYPSLDKAVLFFEVADLQGTMDTIGRERFVHVAAGWAVLRDPEGHSVLLIQYKSSTSGSSQL
jgi:predicted enzyme related to lactoylglutathione lyase